MVTKFLLNVSRRLGFIIAVIHSLIMPTASVVIPTYNRAEVLPRAVNSVLNQRFEDFELIVVDDASTDSTNEVIKSFSDGRLTYIRHQTNKNGSAARNTGISAASGEYIAFLDSDDEWHPNKLKAQIDQLQKRSDDWIANYCGVNIHRSSAIKEFFSDVFSHNGNVEGQEEIIRALLTLSGFIHGGSTLLVKRSVVERIGGFDEEFERHQDIEFTIRVAKEGKIGYVNDDLVTLHESPRPDPETSERAEKQLLQKFETEVNSLHASGHDIRGYHNFVLGRYFIARGNIKKGVKYLSSSRPANTRQVVGLGLDILRVVKGLI